MVEYRHNVILAEDWTKIYLLLDDKLLDEIFQEREALSVCCNLYCDRKLSKQNQNTSKLINLYDTEDAKSDFLKEKVSEEMQNYYFCSPKCRSTSSDIVTQVKNDPESFMFKDLKHFAFLSKYPECKDKYDDLINEVKLFKDMCRASKSIPEEVSKTFKQLDRQSTNQSSSSKANDDTSKTEEDDLKSPGISTRMLI